MPIGMEGGVVAMVVMAATTITVDITIMHPNHINIQMFIFKVVITTTSRAVSVLFQLFAVVFGHAKPALLPTENGEMMTEKTGVWVTVESTVD